MSRVSCSDEFFIKRLTLKKKKKKKEKEKERKKREKERSVLFSLRVSFTL